MIANSEDHSPRVGVDRGGPRLAARVRCGGGGVKHEFVERDGGIEKFHHSDFHYEQIPCVDVWIVF